MIRELMRPANLVTSCSLMAGVYSIVLSAGARPYESHLFLGASLAILVAALFDALDGRVARLTGGGSSFGVQLDSLSDLVSFGVAPGVLLYKWGLHSLGPLGFLCAFAFILAGAFRLARFNMRVERGQERASTSEGLTITFSGSMVATLVLYHHQVVGEAVRVHLPVVALALLLAYLMLSNIRFPVFKDLADSPLGLVVVASMLAGIVVCIAFYHVSFVFVVLGAVYVLSGLLGELFLYGPRRPQEDILYLGTLEPSEDDLGEDDAVEDLVQDLHRGTLPGRAFRRFLGRLRQR